MNYKFLHKEKKNPHKHNLNCFNYSIYAGQYKLCYHKYAEQTRNECLVRWSGTQHVLK